MISLMCDAECLSFQLQGGCRPHHLCYTNSYIMVTDLNKIAPRVSCSSATVIGGE